jgi:hypothetical protein
VIAPAQLTKTTLETILLVDDPVAADQDIIILMGAGLCRVPHVQEARRLVAYLIRQRTSDLEIRSENLAQPVRECERAHEARPLRVALR